MSLERLKLDGQTFNIGTAVRVQCLCPILRDKPTNR